jgi:O-acetyl-ADP-ribose deacetylase (regulator of RNase III)
MRPKIQFVQGDITNLAVDAIVNPANTELTFGSGVAEAIRRKGGRAIEEDCERIGPIRLGEAAVTTGGNLRAFYVIHAASMPPGGKATEESLRLATHNTLLRIEERAFKTVAFPAIGAGAAGLPVDQCARIILKTVLDHIRVRSSLESITFVLFDEPTLKAFEEAYKELTAPATATGS